MSTSESIQVGYAIHRRDFLGGTWVGSHAQTDKSTPHTYRGRVAESLGTAAILVQAQPDHLVAIEQALVCEGFDVVTRDPVGKLVVAVPTSDADAIVAALGAVTSLPGVMTAVLTNSQTTETIRA